MPDTGVKISSLYAWIATDPEGNEGICTTTSGTPMVGADRDHLAGLRHYAEATRKATGWPVRLKMFANGAIVDAV